MVWLTANATKDILGAVVLSDCSSLTAVFFKLQFAVMRAAVLFVRNLTIFIGIGLALLGGNAEARDQMFMTLGTGSVTGVYFPTGNAICRSINETRAEHGIRCAAEPGRGSIGNLEDLRSGKTDFAIIQADWLHHAYSGTSVFGDKGPFSDLRTVLGLHVELATIVVRETSNVQSLTDLKGKRVNIGPAGSGSAATWKQIAELSGWTDIEQRHFTRQDLSGLGEALCTGAIDGYFVFIGHPAGVVEDTQEQCGIRFIELDDQIISAMLEDAAFYRKAVVPDETYEGQSVVATFGTPALVMTTKTMPEAVVDTVVRSVFGDFEDFRTAHPALEYLQRAELANPKTIAPLHLGALHFYREQGYLN